MFKTTTVCSAAMAALGAGLLASGAAAQAQQDASPVRLEPVEVTGSSLKRIDAETALPVTVMTREQIARSGATNIEQLAAMISATSSAGQVTGSTIAGIASYGASSISLRGLGEQRTLVLLNGRRLAVFAGAGTGTGGSVDINAIPLSAVERVEVLRDGASAVYGSDAIAGVVNFILRRDFKGLEATAEAGTPTQSGGGQVYRSNLLFGAGNLESDRYNLMIGLDLEKSRTLYARDRDFSRSGNRAPYFQNGATPSGRIEGVYDPALSLDDNRLDPASNPYGVTSQGYGNPLAPGRCAEMNMFALEGKGGVDGRFDNCGFDSAPYVGLFPTTERVSLFGSGRVDVSPALQLYGEAIYSRTKITESYQQSAVRSDFLETDLLFGPSDAVNPVATGLLLHPQNPAYQSIFVPYARANGLDAMIGKPIAVTMRNFVYGPRTEVDINHQFRAVAGLRGAMADWDYDLAATFNEARTDGQVTSGYFSQYGLARTLNDPSSTWNPWAAGGLQDAATTQALQSSRYSGTAVSGLSRAISLDGSATTALGRLAGGSVQLALGASVRRERYRIEVPDIVLTGDIAGLGGSTLPSDEGRTVAAVFTELNLPLAKTVELDASARYDHYSDVGSTTNGKLSVRWAPAREVVFRGAVGTGFRAPTLVELHQPVTAGVSEQFVDPSFPTAGATQATALLGGNADLKPEKSKQLSLGLVVSPAEGFTGSVDWFLISIDDYIVLPSALALVNGVRNGAPLYGPDDATFFEDGTVDTVDERYRNAASALLRGVDVNLNWAGRMPFGRLSADLSGTYMQTFDLKTLAGTQHNVGTIIQPDGSPLDNAPLGVVSRWKHRLSINWSTPLWSTTLAQNFYTGYHDAYDLEGNPHEVPSVATYDMQVAYVGIPNLKLAAGLRNMFDKRPPLFIGNGNSFQMGYDPANFDPRGRFAYLTATYRFF